MARSAPRKEFVAKEVERLHAGEGKQRVDHDARRMVIGQHPNNSPDREAVGQHPEVLIHLSVSRCYCPTIRQLVAPSSNVNIKMLTSRKYIIGFTWNYSTELFANCFSEKGSAEFRLAEEMPKTFAIVRELVGV